MWRKFASVLIAVIFLASAATASAATNEVCDAMTQKLLRGAVNVATGWTEFPIQIAKGYKAGYAGAKNNKVLGVLTGIFDGTIHAVGRTASGIGDIIGFWAAGPEDNEGIGLKLDGENSWDEGEPYAFLEPGLMNSLLHPVGKKIVRGGSNLLLGVAEFPGQIAKGIAEGAPDLGILKGLYYFASREISGAVELATAIVPGPEGALGIAFETENAWDTLAEEVR